MQQCESITVDNRLSWPGDSGRYLNDCLICGGTFMGDKSRRTCFFCTPSRHLISEECIEFEEPPYYIDNGVAIQLPGSMRHVTVWRFHYSDGDVEQVTRRGLPV